MLTLNVRARAESDSRGNSSIEFVVQLHAVTEILPRRDYTRFQRYVRKRKRE